MSYDFPSRLLKRIVDPATEPLTLAEAKLYLRIDGTVEDSLVTDMIVAVRIAAEEFLRKSLITQTWKLAFGDTAEGEIKLPRGPVTAINSLTLFDTEGNATVVDEDIFVLNAAQDALMLHSDLAAHRIEIVYVAGYADASEVPIALKQGMLAHMATLYDGRDMGTQLPPAAIHMYQPFREIRL